MPFPLSALVVAAALLPNQDVAAPAPRPDVAPLLEPRKLRQAMALLASEHADLVRVLPVGLSRGAPDGEPLRIEALRLAAGELGDGRPAILVVANLEGPTVYTSGLALDLARRLARDHAAGDAEARALLDATTVYVVPRANPDGALGRFQGPLREVRGTGHGVDDDRDGRVGEDGPRDVNGDGYVSWIRVPDPEGTWREDPTDGRILVEADPARGERGVWRLVREGGDADGDGEVAEDPLRDAHVDRNFPAGYEDLAPRAGLYATDEPEARALADFVIAHPDIQLVVVYGEHDNVVAVPDGVDDDAPDSLRVPAPGWRGSDVALLEAIADRYGELGGVEAKGSGDDAGTFARWCYEHRGLLTLAIRPWDVPLEEGETEAEAEAEGPSPSDDARRLAWLEANGVQDAHLGWSSFEHPALGAVEVGGFRPYALVEPPLARRAELVDVQRALLVDLGPRLARVALDGVEARALGAGLVEVRATVVNEGELPLVTTWGRRTRTTRPAKVLLRVPPGATLLSGDRQQLVSELAPSGGRREFVWLLRNAPVDAIGVSVETDHAGRAQAQPESKR